MAKGRQGDSTGELADYTAVLDLPDAPVEQQGQALFNRGVAKRQQGDSAGELADYTAVLDLPDAPVEQQAKALLASGATRAAGGERDHGCEQLRQALDLTQEHGLSALTRTILQALNEYCRQSNGSASSSQTP